MERRITLQPPALAFVVLTRAALAFGMGLLAADRIPRARRHSLALTLIGIGAATTLPAAWLVFGRRGIAVDRRMLASTTE